MGDCGSWVLNSTTGDWLGHIVAGRTGTSVAYIVLARDIMKDISDQLQGKDVKMPGETEFVGEVVHDIKRSLLPPQTQHSQGGRDDSISYRHWPQHSWEDSCTHGNSANDKFLHYFRCIRLSDRDAFLASLPDYEQEKLRRRIVEEQSEIANTRALFEEQGPKTAQGRLLSNFKHRLQMWRRGKRSTPPASFDLDHTQRRPRPRFWSPDDDQPESADGKSIVDVLKANVVYFKTTHQDHDYPTPYDHPYLEGHFPYQTIPLDSLLYSRGRNPLIWKCEEGMIRWFHIPANNMIWIEVSPVAVQPGVSQANGATLGSNCKVLQ